MQNGWPEGVGIGLRREFAAELMESDRPVDWLEIIPENFVGKGGPFARHLDRCKERWPIAAHGVSFNLGGPDPLDAEQFAALKGFLDQIGAPGFTEHLCYSMVEGHQSFDLLPLPHTADAARWVGSRIREAQERLERPIFVENISTYAIMPGAEMTDGEFHHAVCEEADCGLLLDVNNVFVNAMNHGTDPVETLKALPLHRARQMHIAGHDDRGDVVIDNHGSPIRPEVFELFRVALRETGPLPVLVEWDLNIPELSVVLDQADEVRRIFHEVTGDGSAKARPSTSAEVAT